MSQEIFYAITPAGSISREDVQITTAPSDKPIELRVAGTVTQDQLLRSLRAIKNSIRVGGAPE